MYSYLILLFLMISFLTFTNFFLKRFKISLDVETTNETHKFLLRKNNITPLSGIFYFLPIIIISFYGLNIEFLIFYFAMSVLGFCSDLKIIVSYKIRLFIQFFLIFVFLYLSKDIAVITKIYFIDYLMGLEITRILICTFFFMVLINGFNLIDGANCLCSLYSFIITVMIILLSRNLEIIYLENELIILLLALLVFISFNFFGKNFLGDGAAYGFGFLFGYILIKISILNINVSPYFIANLLWYPALENLFSIARRSFFKKNNYLPDNEHLHHLIFVFLEQKFRNVKTFFISSLVGIVINTVIFLNFIVSINFYHHTIIQIILILTMTFLYMFFYLILKKNQTKSYK